MNRTDSVNSMSNTATEFLIRKYPKSPQDFFMYSIRIECFLGNIENGLIEKKI